MNAENLYPNIKRLCKKQKLKIGELEKEIGVSAGYFSRTTKVHGEKSIGIDKVLTIANKLDVTLDELLSEPPMFTNADKFAEVFGEKAINMAIASRSWWGEPFYESEGENGRT